MDRKRKEIQDKQRKILWAKSGGKCAICKTDIINQYENKESYYPSGKESHIEGEMPGSARYNSSMTDNERRSFENLILLCGDCHTKIDEDTDWYTPNRLKQIKKDHIEWVYNSLRSQMPDVTFAELDVIIKYLMANPVPESDMIVIPPKEKINKNNLSSDVEKLIIMGMLQKRLIVKYLNQNPDFQFADRLRSGFVNKYNELVTEGLREDSLFDELWNFASNNSNDFKIRAAGLSILTYFFEICDIFEK